MSSGAMPSRSSSSTEAPTSSASARSPPASSSRTAPLGGTCARLRLEQRRARGDAARAARWPRSARERGVEDHVLARQRLEQLDRRRAARQRGAAGLVAERDGDLGVRVAHERLDEVQLGGREVVEAVEQDSGRPSHASRSCVQRGARQAVGVDGAERLEPPVVGGVQRGELARVRRRGPGLAPRAHRRAEARRARRASAAARRTGRRARPRTRGRRPRRRARAARTSRIAARTTRSRASRPSGRPRTPAVRAMSRIRRGKVVTSAPKTSPAPASSRA